MEFEIGDTVTIDSFSVVYGQKEVLIEDAGAEVIATDYGNITLKLDDPSLVPDWADGTVQIVSEMTEFTDYGTPAELLEDVCTGDGIDITV